MLKKLSVIALTTLALATSTVASAKDSLLDRINQKGTITVGTEGTYAPFTYHDESGKLTGYDVEVTRAVAEKLGVKVEFKETNWDSMLAGLKAGRFDLVANQVALTTPERQAIFDKSEAYNWSGAVLVAPKTETRIQKIEDVKGLRAAQSLTSNYGELARKYEAVLVPVDGLAQSIKVIETKRADFTFNDSLAILDYIKKNPKSDLKILVKKLSFVKPFNSFFNFSTSEVFHSASAFLIASFNSNILSLFSFSFLTSSILVKR